MENEPSGPEAARFSERSYAGGTASAFRRSAASPPGGGVAHQAGLRPASTTAPSAADSFAAASITCGSRLRGRGGRIRMDGALIWMTATTEPVASRTGAAMPTAPATTSSEVIR